MSPVELRTSHSTTCSMCSSLSLLHWGPNFRYMNPWGHIWTCSDHSSQQFGVPNFLGRTIGTKTSLFPPFWYAHDHWFFFLWPFPSLVPVFNHLPRTLTVPSSALWENVHQDNDKDRVLSFIRRGVFLDCFVFTWNLCTEGFRVLRVWMLLLPELEDDGNRLTWAQGKLRRLYLIFLYLFQRIDFSLTEI